MAFRISFFPCFERYTLYRISMASGPVTRTIPIPDGFSAVEIAAIVCFISHSCLFLSGSLRQLLLLSLEKTVHAKTYLFCIPASPSTPFSSGKTFPVFISISIAKAPAFSTHVISMCLPGRSFTYIIVLLTVLLSDNTHFSLRSRQRVCTVRFLRCRFLQTYCSAEQNE